MADLPAAERAIVGTCDSAMVFARFATGAGVIAGASDGPSDTACVINELDEASVFVIIGSVVTEAGIVG